MSNLVSVISPLYYFKVRFSSHQPLPSEKSLNIIKMARTGFFHHIGTFLLFAGAVLLLITTISAPVVNNISILKVHLSDRSTAGYSSVTFGTFGYCMRDATDPKYAALENFVPHVETNMRIVMERTPAQESISAIIQQSLWRELTTPISTAPQSTPLKHSHVL